jgi:hypothetical protein
MTTPSPVIAPEFSYEPLAAFPLLWRWTQATHDVLTSDELASIRPLRHESATAAHEYAGVLRSFKAGATQHAFQLTDEDELGLGEWLAQLPVEHNEHVVLSWSPTLAVETAWSLVLCRWSAFWYPSSDDLDVFPAAGNWLLQASHSGRYTLSVLPTR